MTVSQFEKHCENLWWKKVIILLFANIESKK